MVYDRKREKRKHTLYKISKSSDKLLMLGSFIFMLLFSAIILIPFWSVVMDSFSNTNIKSGFRLWPEDFSFNAYRSVFSQKTLAQNYFNTIFRTVVGTILCVGITFLAAYPLSKKKLPFNRLFTYLVLFTMYFSGGLIPQYLLFKSLGFIDNYLVLILPTMFNGFYILVMRNFICSIPAEFEESANIDGANDFIIAFIIYFPLLLPIIATITLWSAVRLWNEWFIAMIYIQSSLKQVMQVLLRKILIETQLSSLYDDGTIIAEQTEDAVKAVTIVVTIIPIISIYPFAQKYFIRGLTAGGIKG